MDIPELDRRGCTAITCPTLQKQTYSALDQPLDQPTTVRAVSSSRFLRTFRVGSSSQSNKSHYYAILNPCTQPNGFAQGLERSRQHPRLDLSFTRACKRITDHRSSTPITELSQRPNLGPICTCMQYLRPIRIHESIPCWFHSSHCLVIGCCRHLTSIWRASGQAVENTSRKSGLQG